MREGRARNRRQAAKEVQQTPHVFLAFTIQANALTHVHGERQRKEEKRISENQSLDTTLYGLHNTLFASPVALSVQCRYCRQEFLTNYFISAW